MDPFLSPHTPPPSSSLGASLGLAWLTGVCSDKSPAVTVDNGSSDRLLGVCSCRSSGLGGAWVRGVRKAGEESSVVFSSLTLGSKGSANRGTAIDTDAQGAEDAASAASSAYATIKQGQYTGESSILL